MVTSQTQRSGAARAWWAHTGSTNRGFVSLDPERQREVDSGRPAPRRATGSAFAFDVSAGGTRGRSDVPGRRAPKAPGPASPADAAPRPASADATDDNKTGRRR